ncbi:mdf-1 [Pristionchus pacificus]|uniref:Mdf-1 n=1 Tax=Pristionchus pacificus TaxID=54126 RepID=A0A2A6B9Q1_PRIPA|nr:mdf-1 [Pristionchus pacificus]|eukprot:PDM62593.1 mdf-1 [Pristionchus pacificus]
MQMDSSPLSESDDSMSESTRVFNLKMEKEFVKAFPLRSDQRISMGPPTSTLKGNPTFGKTPLMRGQAPVSTPHSMRNMKSSTPIRFSLDESFITGATAQNLSSKVAELTTELDLHKRKLERQSKELATTIERMERYKIESEELIRGNAELKKNKQRLEDDLRGAQLMTNTDTTTNSSSSTVINKLFTWLEWKEAQLNTMAAIMASAQLWTEDNRNLVANSYRSIEPIMLSQDDVAAYASGSVQDFQGIHESPIAEAVEVEEERNPNDTTLREDNETIYMDESSTEDIQNNQSTRILPFEDEQESAKEISILNNTMYEKDEKIEKLEFELNKAIEQLELYKGRTTKLAVMEEENQSLKHRLGFLEQMHNDSIRDLHASARLCENQLASTMTSPDGKKMEREEARSLTLTMRTMQRQIDELGEIGGRSEKELQVARDEIMKIRSELEASNNYSNQLSKDVQTMSAEKGTLMEQLAEAKRQLEEVNRVDMTTLVNDTLVPESVATDAGDTTQIVHFQFNPLDQARRELRDEERKRSLGGCEGPSVKRRRSEDDAEMEELRKKLAMAESRCERLSNHSIDSVRNFRNIILKVTGYDIKMKQEDSVQLTSTYDTLNQHFGFMVRDGRVEMIELMDKPFDGPDRFQFEAEMWMGERNSVPGFLAACQIKLLEEALVQPEETLMYGNEGDEFDPSGPSFSILQED